VVHLKDHDDLPSSDRREPPKIKRGHQRSLLVRMIVTLRPSAHLGDSRPRPGKRDDDGVLVYSGDAIAPRLRQTVAWMPSFLWEEAAGVADPPTRFVPRYKAAVAAAPE
jgi:hypothetical protein